MQAYSKGKQKTSKNKSMVQLFSIFSETRPQFKGERFVFKQFPLAYSM